MSITASQVKELRDMSGVGMMECKKALVETNILINPKATHSKRKGKPKVTPII